MTALEQARAHFEAGEFAKARAAAIDGLGGAPEDVELLRVAGRAGVETGAADAVEQLQKVAELQPASAEAWRDLGDALAAEGRTEEANDAFRKVLEIDPEDEVALTALGHTAFQAGERGEAVSMLEQVAGRMSGSTAAISLVEMYKTLEQPDEALAAARRVAQAEPRGAAVRARRGRAGPGDRRRRRGRRRVRPPAGARRPPRGRGRGSPGPDQGGACARPRRGGARAGPPGRPPSTRWAARPACWRTSRPTSAPSPRRRTPSSAGSRWP